jgi:hypothetical protein
MLARVRSATLASGLPRSAPMMRSTIVGAAAAGAPRLLRRAVSTSAPATPAASDAAAAPAAAAPAAAPVRLNTAAEVVWLFRVCLRHTRNMPNRPLSIEATIDAKRQFRAQLALKDERAIRKALMTAYSKLSFLRMGMPKSCYPKLGLVPAEYPAARAMFGSGLLAGSGGEPPDGVHTFVYYGGEKVPAHTRDVELITSEAGGGDRISNSQGVTDNDVKRHYAMIERMQFKGPYWKNLNWKDDRWKHMS